MSASRSPSPSSPSSSCAARGDRHPASRPVRADKDRARRHRKEPLVERPLRLIAANPLDALARTPKRCSSSPPAAVVEELCEAATNHPERVETALGLLASAIARAGAGSCSRRSPAAGRFVLRARRRRPAAGCSSARSSGTCRRPPSRRSRSSRTSAGVAAGDRALPRCRRDSAVAGLLERGLISEAGRGDLGVVRYRVTPLFERVFGLESLAVLPRLDDSAPTPRNCAGGSSPLAERRPA